jgi:hypothetical protein
MILPNFQIVKATLNHSLNVYQRVHAERSAKNVGSVRIQVKFLEKSRKHAKTNVSS